MAVVVAVGCEGKTVQLEPGLAGASGAAGTATNADDDGASSCELGQEKDWGPYGICSYFGIIDAMNGSPVNADNKQECDNGSNGWYGGVNGECGGCHCIVSCAEQDCPLPETGNVTPRCEQDRCLLPCSHGERCPDGMTCTTDMPWAGTGAYYCAWVFSEDNSLSCAYTTNPDVCSGFSTQTECEAHLDPTPGEPLACLWATVSTFATGNDACEPLQVEQKCVTAQLPKPDDIADSQRCGDSFVYLQDDLGDGTATLIEVQRCGYVPFDTTPCDFGNSTLPALCDCACGGT